jgi:hypothetical protein
VSVWGVTMVKDEDDVIEQNLRHLHAQGLAGVIALDNGSTDDTRPLMEQVAEEWPGWLRIVDDPEVGYWQSAKMTSAARMAQQLGAVWVIPFDADELWGSLDDRPLAESIMLHGDSVNGQAAVLYDHRCTALDEGSWASSFDDPFTRMAWRHTTPLPLPKVAVRVAELRSIHPGNHGADLRQSAWSQGVLEVRHFPYRSPEQMLSKVRNGAAAYAQTTLARTTGQHWREMGETLDAHGPEGLLRWFNDAFFFQRPAEAGLVYDPAKLALEATDAE